VALEEVLVIVGDLFMGNHFQELASYIC